MGHFNLIEMKGFYSFKVWRIKILCGRIYLNSDGKLKVENTNNAIKDRYKDALMKKFSLTIMKLIEVKKVELFFSGGFKDNSFTSAIVCGSAKMIVNTIYGYLSQNYEDVKLFEDIKPTFGSDSFELTFDFVASVSIFQIIRALIKSKKLILKENKE